MNNLVDEELLKVSKDLGEVNTGNEAIDLIASAMKYLTDRLIDKETKISKEDELKINYLFEKLEGLKSIFVKYQIFFSQNKALINELVKLKSSMNLLNDNIFLNSSVIELTDFFGVLMKDFIDIISYTDTFFTINNFSKDEKNSFNGLLEIIGKGKTKDEKIHTLKNELYGIESFINRLDVRFNIFNNLIPELNSLIGNIKQEILKMFLEKVDGFFTEISTNNISFEFKNNLILTLFLEDIFSKLPKNNFAFESFLKLLLKIGTSTNFKLIESNIIINEKDYETLLLVFEFYSKLYDMHFDSQIEISKIKKQIANINSTTTILFPEEVEKEKKLGVFSNGKQKFLHDLAELKSNPNHFLDDLKIEKQEIGNSELLKIKKEIFEIIFEILCYFSILTEEQVQMLHNYIGNKNAQEISEELKSKKKTLLSTEKNHFKIEVIFLKDFNLKLMDWLVFYNTKRKHGGINYITPMQKLENLLEKKLVCL